MAETSKPQTKDGTEHKRADRPEAESVDREPNDEPTPEGHGMHVRKEDEPKGHPTSDRFHSEQAHTSPEETG